MHALRADDDDDRGFAASTGPVPARLPPTPPPPPAGWLDRLAIAALALGLLLQVAWLAALPLLVWRLLS